VNRGLAAVTELLPLGLAVDSSRVERVRRFLAVRDRCSPGPHRKPRAAS
jgi:hypothetical protein